MTPTHKEKMRWQLAGQIMISFIADHSKNSYTNGLKVKPMVVDAVAVADALIAELEKTAPKEICDHNLTWGKDSTTGLESCKKCGKIFTGDEKEVIRTKLSPEPRMTSYIPLQCEHKWMDIGGTKTPPTFQCSLCGMIRCV